MFGLTTDLRRLPVKAASRRAAAAPVAALLTVLLAVSCVADSPDGTNPAATKGSVDPGASQTGNYLAGRHAQARGDLSAAADFLGAALKQAPDTPNLLRRTFVLTAMEGRMEDATALARRVVAVNAKAPIAELMVVVDDIKAGRFAEAEKRLAGLSKNGFNLVMRPLLSAWARVGLGKPDAALDALKPLAEEDRSRALHDLHAALINETAGQAEAAEKQYLRVADGQNGPSLRVVQLLGALYERAGKADKATEIYRNYLEEQPQTRLLEPALARVEAGTAPALAVASAAEGAAEGLFGVASSLRQQNASESALLFGQMGLYLRPEFPVMQILIGQILESQERLESANKVYASIDPASPFSWSARLRIASNLNRLDRADEAVERLRAMAGEHPDQAEALINLGDILRGRERYSEAVDAYDRAMTRIVTLERRHWSLLYARGIVLERSKQWPRAEADFLRALEFEPEQPYVLNYLGYSWVDKGRNLDKAHAMIKKAVTLRPRDGYIVDSLGWVLYRSGQYGKAVRELERAVELRPGDPVINDHLGDAYWKVGRRQEARFQWRRALGFDPEPDVKATIESKLDKGLVEKAETGGDG